MPVPAIVAGAAAIAGRLAAKKVAKEVAKKAAKTATSKGYGMGKKGLTVSNDVRIKSSTSSSKLKANPGAKQVIDQNIKTASKTTKAEAKANARGLKAANAKVSKNNAGQTGSKLKSDILKNATPARANRERGGSLKTLRSQGKTKPTPPRNKSK